MPEPSNYKLIGAVIEASVANDWYSAVREWEIVDMEEDERCEQGCVCGHEHLRYLFTLRNRLNGNELYPIGNICIKKFERDDLDSELRARMQAIKLAQTANALGTGGQVELKGGSFTRDLINYMRDEGAFPDNKYNYWDGDNDGRFLLDMFNKRGDLTERQGKKVYAVIRNAVYPWLRGVWRDTHNGQAPRF
ncbi:MAG: hypothetical protein IKG22_08765 [Atopobiaceae bacterium]|nr:hypothetical protein [Atopobiaceae bacterium]